MSKQKFFSAYLRNFIYPAVLLLTKTRVKFRVVSESVGGLLPGKPMIFAVNHSNSFDAPVASQAIYQTFGMRCNILAGIQNLWLSDRLFFFLHGTIWVDRQSKADMAASKETLVSYLKQQQSILWFPEGAWNLTDNLLMLPMKWGIIDVAVKTRAQIVPVALNYDRKTMRCCVNFGMPIAPNEATDKADTIRELRDAMSTLRWELWEKQTSLKRDEIDRVALKKDIFIALEEYPPLDWDYEQTVIFQPYTSPQEAFAHLDKLIPCQENAFLWNKRYYNIRKQ